MRTLRGYPVICAEDGCDQPSRSVGLCNVHYDRRKRAGTLPKPHTADQRFWLRVKKGPGCWEWGGPPASTGYGQFGHDGRSDKAHRFAYESAVGPIPAGYEIDHLCRNRICVRPDHLEAVPPRVNNLRSESPAALNARKTHCVHGHPFDELNTYMPPNRPNNRQCRTCYHQRYLLHKAELEQRAAS